MSFFFCLLVILSFETLYAQDTGLSKDLKKFSIPKVESKISEPVKRLFEIRSPELGILAKDGKTLYFNWKVTGISQVWKVSKDKPFPIQVTFGYESSELNAVSQNGQFIIVTKDKDGQEKPSVCQIFMPSGKENCIENLKNTTARFHYLSKNDSWLIYSANDVASDRFTFYKLELNSLKKNKIFDEAGLWTIADTWKNEKKFLMTNFTGAKNSQHFDFNLETQKLKPIIGQEESNDYSVLYHQRENEYFVLKATENFKQIYHLKDNQLKPITYNSDQYEISYMKTDPSRNILFYSVSKDGYIKLKALSTINYSEIILPKHGDMEPVFLGNTSNDGKNTIFGYITSKTPRVSFSYNWKTKKITEWHQPSYSSKLTDEFIPPRLMHYVTRDNIKVPMFVRFPKSCSEQKICPIVVHFHGGPEEQAKPGFNPMAQAFVEAGYVFVEPNVRGSDGYGIKWLNSDNQLLREKVLTDIEDASIWIRKNWGSQKVGILGWSYGGYSALVAMTHFNGSYDAAVSISGISNLVTFLNTTSEYRKKIRFGEYGDPNKDNQYLNRISPYYKIENIKKPILLIHGMNDPKVVPDQSISFYNRLIEKNKNGLLYLIEDDGHISSKTDNQVLEVGHAINFFNQHLKSN